MTHSLVAFRKNRSRTLFYSTSTSVASSSSEVSIAALSPRARTIASSSSSSNPSSISPSTGTKHKRPFSSVAVYHHYDNDVDVNVDVNVNVNLDLDNFLNNVNRNHDTTTATMETQLQHHHHHQQQKHQQHHQRAQNNTNTNTNIDTTTNGSCCYNINNTYNTPRFPCGSNQHEDELDDLPPPLAEPKYSVHKRVLPAELTAFSSQQGKRYLMEAFAGGTAESYWKLTEHFVNQSDPAFCGVTTLLMCLNAMCIDPNIRWRGGWRFYGNEDVLLNRCCFSAERIRRNGIILEDFARLGRCHGLTIDLKRPPSEDQHLQSHDNSDNDSDDDNDDDNEVDQSSFSLDDFRSDIRSIISDTKAKHQPILVVSFSRLALGQTGDGHFSPIAAYHEETDQVLVLDVARFKYAPYWVGVKDLFKSMREADSVTKKPRGWFRMSPPKNHECIDDDNGQEDRRPVEFVPKLGEPEVCPISSIKVHFCKGNTTNQNPVLSSSSSSHMKKMRSTMPL